LEELQKVIKDIAAIKIQGATNVVMAGIKAFANYIRSIEIKDFNHLKKEIEKAQYLLSNARPTEPGLVNGLKNIIEGLNLERIEKEGTIEIAKQRLSLISNYYINVIKEAKEAIGEIGARRIEDGSIIMTHCHSSVVINIFKTAKEMGKNFKVICTETRPKYQGRLTAKELIEYKIPTTMIVDSAMRWVLKNRKVNLIITGCDSITSEGTIINKIGSRLLALAAHEMDVPFYIATPLIKYDPNTSLGYLIEIEERDPSEVWKDVPNDGNFKILNPAFETISREYIDALITNVGVFPPTMISHIYEREMAKLIKKLRELE